MSEEILDTDEVTVEVTDEITKEGTEGENKFNKFEQCILKKIINDKIFYQCKLCEFISERKEVVKTHLNKKNKCYNTDSTECKYCRRIFKNK